MGRANNSYRGVKKLYRQQGWSNPSLRAYHRGLEEGYEEMTYNNPFREGIRHNQYKRGYDEGKAKHAYHKSLSTNKVDNG